MGRTAEAKQAAGAPAARRPGRPTKAEGHKLRDDLLKFATREFLKNGYAGSTIDAISARSKIRKMTIYRHFPSKEHLFRAVVIRIGERFRSSFAEVRQENRSVEEVLADFAMASYDDPASEEMLGITRILIAEAGKFPDLVYTMYQHRREMLQPLTDYLARMVATGRLAFDWEPELAAFQFVALASGGIRALMVPREIIERGRHNWTTAAVKIFLSGTLVPA